MRGRIPEELNGRLLRIGPNPVAAPDPQTYHWFTGSGMVHGVRIRDGKAEWYRNRFVRDDNVTASEGLADSSRTAPRHGLRHREHERDRASPGARSRSSRPAGCPVELTYDLDTVQMSDFDGTLPGSFTAHPKRDPQTGELHAVVYYWEWDHAAVRRRRHRRSRARAPSTSPFPASRWCTTARSPSPRSSSSTFP